jgi:uncharacterized protein with HEPN domain
MAREWLHFVDDMFSAIAAAESMLIGKSLEDYKGDLMLRLATQRIIEIISEASRSLPEAIRATKPEIEWRKVNGIGNILRHEYFVVSDDVIWETMINDLPSLK